MRGVRSRSTGQLFTRAQCAARSSCHKPTLRLSCLSSYPRLLPTTSLLHIITLECCWSSISPHTPTHSQVRPPSVLSSSTTPSKRRVAVLCLCLSLKREGHSLSRKQSDVPTPRWGLQRGTRTLRPRGPVRRAFPVDARQGEVSCVLSMSSSHPHPVSPNLSSFVRRVTLPQRGQAIARTEVTTQCWLVGSSTDTLRMRRVYTTSTPSSGRYGRV